MTKERQINHAENALSCMAITTGIYHKFETLMPTLLHK